MTRAEIAAKLVVLRVLLCEVGDAISHLEDFRSGVEGRDYAFLCELRHQITDMAERYGADCSFSYQYRNLPITEATHFVAGHDLLLGANGILEWCTSEEDAENILAKMMAVTNRFSHLRISRNVG